jgi:hypothetical protein
MWCFSQFARKRKTLLICYLFWGTSSTLPWLGSHMATTLTAFLRSHMATTLTAFLRTYIADAS